MDIRLSDAARHRLPAKRRAARRNGHPAYLSWIGPVLISGIVAGWLLARADAANPPSEEPARSAVAISAAPAPDTEKVATGESTLNSVTPTGLRSSDHGSGVQQSNIAPADVSGDEEGASNPPARAAQAMASVDGVTLLRQSLRRGGLGSKALMTLTIRNSNDYPVKHIQLLCSFRSQDGRYETERRHLINGVVRPNSRRTFRHMMVGFVSINANRATCSLLSADWA